MMFAILYFRTVIHRNFLAYYIVGYPVKDIKRLLIIKTYSLNFEIFNFASWCAFKAPFWKMTR
jgi:transposase-like protein